MSSGKNLIQTLLGEWNQEGSFRFHMAKTEPSGSTPLQALAHSDGEWEGWQLYRGKEKERFTKPFVVTFAQVSDDRFLFGGLYEIVDRSGEDYAVERKSDLQEFIGRLVVSFKAANTRSTVFKPQYFFEHAEVAELYPIRYQGEVFPGLEQIHHGFRDLEIVFKNDLSDWKAALSNAKGVYLIVDESSGMQYVGSAYGDDGFWGRWGQYLQTLHGGNKHLIALVKEKSGEHVKNYFRYSILEVVGSSLIEEQVIAKESLWKNKLGSRAFGLNAN